MLLMSDTTTGSTEQRSIGPPGRLQSIKILVMIPPVTMMSSMMMISQWESCFCPGPGVLWHLIWAGLVLNQVCVTEPLWCSQFSVCYLFYEHCVFLFLNEVATCTCVLQTESSGSGACQVCGAGAAFKLGCICSDFLLLLWLVLCFNYVCIFVNAEQNNTQM